jgi:hypothetical protein
MVFNHTTRAVSQRKRNQMSNRNDLSEDELAIVDAFRNGDRLMRARIFHATMSLDRDATPDEVQELEFLGAYLDCNKTGRSHISKAMELLASGKSHEEVDRYLASDGAVRPKAEVIDIGAHRPSD